MAWLMVLVGLVILLFAGDALVKGAVNLSLRLGVPALIVSLTIVAFGTSAPELLVSIQAVMDNASGIALGNVVGSNTANILLVLGIPALITTIHASRSETRNSFVQMIGASLLFIALCAFGTLTWISGLVLLVGLALMLAHAGRSAARQRESDVEGADPDMPWPWIMAFLVGGLVGLPLGAHLLVEGAVSIARAYGVSETVIGLTLVAIGTSLPELATTVMAARRQQADVALGNVIGSNMFNLLGIMGIASLVGPVQVDPMFLTRDLWIMLAASLLLVPAVFFGRDLTKAWGVGLSALYLVYLMAVLG
ncbi:MAG: calcium/sodium antiporter [Limimaricola sp.]|nr:calcium/sodium antiporter [Limimaricola sp.]